MEEGEESLTTVLCIIDLFTLRQRVVVYKDNEVIESSLVSMEELPEAILKGCYSNDIHSVHLKGYSNVVNNLKEKLISINNTHYGQEISIEITEV